MDCVSATSYRVRLISTGGARSIVGSLEELGMWGANGEWGERSCHVLPMTRAGIARHLAVRRGVKNESSTTQKWREGKEGMLKPQSSPIFLTPLPTLFYSLSIPTFKNHRSFQLFYFSFQLFHFSFLPINFQIKKKLLKNVRSKCWLKPIGSLWEFYGKCTTEPCIKWRHFELLSPWGGVPEGVGAGA